ncbi:MAG: sugar ABC transporter ATP-binding protein [Sedimentisphaerales bacterium]|nr:sugar ABC transporter ATP-binding protein [Sedimentisphaerales bacterium]
MAAGGEARLVMRGVSKAFGATRALRDVSLDVQGGEVSALVGENGAGKSTLMKVLSGAIKADKGTIELEGRAYRPGNPLQARREGVAMIYQELSLAEHLTVEENIVLGVEPTRFGLLRRQEIRRKTREVLRHFEHPEIRPDVKVGQLSTAARQLVEIARALAGECKVLILDEPTSSLTQRDIQTLFALIERLKEQGLAIIYISHFLEEVKQIADRVVVLRDGATVGERERAELETNDIITLMVGRELEELYPRSPRRPGETILSLRGLSGQTKPIDVDLELRRGEVLGIAGLVGAGRTELMRAIFGLDSVQHGEVKIGTYSGPASPWRRWRQGAGYLSENRKDEGLAVSLSIADNVTLSRLPRLISPSRQAKASRRWIDRLGIRCQEPYQPVADLSGGNQQKVAFARLLYHDVDVWLLDEPTRGIDVAAKAVIYRLIDELTCGDTERAPRAVLMVSSYLPELLGICDRIAIMCRGRLGPARPVVELSEHQLMCEAVG